MSILLDKPVKRTSMTIWVPRESWIVPAGADATGKNGRGTFGKRT